MDRMASFPIEHETEWYARLQTIAVSEVNRLMYGHGVMLDRDDAIAFAISETWIVIHRMVKRPANFWGFCRVVMYNRLRTKFVARSMAKKRGGPGVEADRTRIEEPARHVPAIFDEGEPNPELLTNTWADVEDAIALGQIAARYEEHVTATAHAKHVTNKSSAKVSRQREHQRRSLLAHYGRRIQCRRYDK